MVNFGNPRMTLGENIFTCICFFFYGLNYLVFFNGVVNVGDRLFDQFDYNLAFMSTYPL
ncbi:nucleoside transporter, putative, partial [Entamoeba invadens IP1]